MADTTMMDMIAGRSKKTATLSLYDLFCARFAGMDEKQIRALISYDERVRSPEVYFKLDTKDFKSWSGARSALCRELGLMGVDERLVPICLAYYVEYCRTKGRDYMRKLWQLIYAARDSQLFMKTCMSLHRYEYLLACFPDLSKEWLIDIMQACYGRIGTNGAGNGYFWMAFETAQKLNDRKMLNKLCRLAFDKGEPNLAKLIAMRRGEPLNVAEKRRVARTIVHDVARSGDVSDDELRFLAKHTLGYELRVVHALIRAAGDSTSPDSTIRAALYAAKKLGHRFTDSELKRMWAILSEHIDPFYDPVRLEVLQILKRRDKRFQPIFLKILCNTLARRTRDDTVESMRKIAEELGHELTSPDWFERYVHNDHNRSETLELLAQSLAAGTGPSKLVHPGHVEVDFLLHVH